MAQAQSNQGWRDRKVETRTMRAGEILPHPRNPKIHTDRQHQLVTGLLNEVGRVGGLRAYYSARHDGMLTLFDGHERRSLNLDQEWEVEIYDLTDAEADLLLPLLDHSGSLAELNTEALDALLRDISTGEPSLQDELDQLATAAGIVEGRAADEEPFPIPEGRYQEQYGVIVLCKNEGEQEEIYSRLTDEGYTCKVVVT